MYGERKYDKLGYSLYVRKLEKEDSQYDKNTHFIFVKCLQAIYYTLQDPLMLSAFPRRMVSEVIRFKGFKKDVTATEQKF